MIEIAGAVKPDVSGLGPPTGPGSTNFVRAGHKLCPVKGVIAAVSTRRALLRVKTPRLPLPPNKDEQVALVVRPPRVAGCELNPAELLLTDQALLPGYCCPLLRLQC